MVTIRSARSLALDDTIAAIASPPGPAARGIVRISGSAAIDIIRKMIDVDVPETKRPFRLPGRLHSPQLGTPLKASVLVWPTARSYTGQPMAEIHTIGSPPLLELVVESLLDLGARPAERGEFTMRSFLNGRIDLVQAEAVTGVIDAADHEELEQALMQLGGGLTQTLRRLQSDIISVLGDLEAGLDFVEEDIEFISADEILRRLRACAETLNALRESSSDRLPSGHRPRIVLAGLPNAGKSTLFNRLTDSTNAIASPHAGTTRDWLCGDLRLDGVVVELIDTAGWEQPSDAIGELAQQRRAAQVASSDLVIWCSAADLSPEEQQADFVLQAAWNQPSVPFLVVTTCADRITCSDPEWNGLAVSAERDRDSTGCVDRVYAALSRTASARGELKATTSVRCRDCLQQAAACVELAIENVIAQAGDEIVAVDLRATLEELRGLLGETCTDDILDHIFSSFCIGK